MEKANQNVLRWLFGLSRRKKRLIQIFFDAFSVLVSLLLAYYLRLETLEFLDNKDTYIGILIAIAAVFCVYTIRGLYDSFNRHISTEAAYSIAIGSAAACAAVFAGIMLLELKIPHSVPLIFGILLSVFSLGARLIIRSLGQNVSKGNREAVAIYGAGAAGIQLMKALRQSPHYRVRFFIDDNFELNGKNLDGVPIHGLDHAKSKFKKLNINTLLLAIPSNIDETRQRVFDLLPGHPLRVKTIPSISSLISGRSTITDLKEIKVEDLLGRQPVQFNADLMAKNITNKKVLVTGAGGSIGSELCRQIIEWKPKQLILLDVSEFATYTLLRELTAHPLSKALDIVSLIGSVQDNQFIKKVFDCFDVDTIYHAAAYKHVPLMEQNVMQCIANNVFGTLNMADLAITAKVKNFILVSTDKAVRPTNFMGASKRLAELICQSYSIKKSSTCFSIVRFGNVLGSSGSVVPLFNKQIAVGGPIIVTHKDVTRYFMTIPEAAQLVIQAGSIAKNGEVFVLDMGEPIKILDLAKRMVTLTGLSPAFDKTKPLKGNEILIIFSGLRPGEKMFEELTYDKTLLKTMHPRINKTSEKKLDAKDLKELLAGLKIAINDGDHNKLCQIISSVNTGELDVNASHDAFIRR
jgi:FlaA1/EpsC-like NDP-sugar epimerase